MSCSSISQEQKAKVILAQLQALKELYWTLYPDETCVDIVLEKNEISIFPHSADDEEIYKDD